MLHRSIYFFLPLFFLVFSCENTPQEGKTDVKKEIKYDLDQFNDLSTFLTLDSIQKQDRRITVYFTDTSKFYQPERHAQFYTLLFLTSLSTDILKSEIDYVTFNVSMMHRKDGDIIQSFPSNQLLSIIEPYNSPKVKAKIIELNKYNRQEYLSWTDKENVDVLFKLNMYFGKIMDPTSWIGVDSYRIIWEYEFNKAQGQDSSAQLDAINNILSDTLYLKQRELGRKVHQILMK